MATNSFDFTTLGQWPVNCTDQQFYMAELQNRLSLFLAFISDNTAKVVVLSQALEPTQAQWEAAWIVQTGLSLPIPASATLLWYDTVEDTLGGVFGTVTGDSTVYRREHLFPRGAVIVDETYHENTSRSSTFSMLDNDSILPTHTFTLRVTADIWIEFEATIASSSGTDEWGLDFLVNNVKVGTQFHSIAPDSGMLEGTTIARQRLFYVLEDMPPGDYEIKPLLGVANAPATAPTISWGGTDRVTSFRAKAIAK